MKTFTLRFIKKKWWSKEPAYWIAKSDLGEVYSASKIEAHNVPFIGDTPVGIWKTGLKIICRNAHEENDKIVFV